MLQSASRPWLDRRRASLDAIPPIERVERDGVLEVTRGFRGLTLERALGYLEHLGGVRRSDRVVEGEGWRAELATQTVPVGPSYRLTEVRVTWTGRPAIVEDVVLQFRLKTFRAPG